MAESQTRTENARGDVSLSPDSFQVLPRIPPAGNENPRGPTETQMIQDRELLSIMEDISENPVRSSERSAMVASESRVRVSAIGAVGSDKRNASNDTGRIGGIENRTAVGHVGHDRNRGDENRTAVGHVGHDRNRDDENRTAVGHEMHGRSEMAGTDTGLGTRTVIGHEVPVPADDGWSEEESKRLIENPRDDARISSSGEERDRKAS